MSLMKIEMGKRYVTRDGQVIRRVLAVDCVGDEPVVAELMNGAIVTYTAEGRFHACEEESGLDLVAEHDERREWALDTLLVVSVTNMPDSLRYFAGIDEKGCLRCFQDGRSSLTARKTYPAGECTTARIATSEDIERLSPRLPEWCAKRKEN